MYRIDNHINHNKLDVLIKQDKKLFHTADLGLLWDIKNKNTLYMSVYRLVKRGSLFPVHKGLYSVLPVNQLDSIILGASVLHRYTYLSTESVLSQAGIIHQNTYKITFVSDVSKMFSVGANDYLVRKLQTKFLYNTAGINSRGDGVLIADVKRAIADLLYFQPGYHFDADSLIDWNAVKLMQKEIGYI